ncbi:hypothetical protein ABT354_35325 [Streptomyces sp. NPDC000594]|uniref:hypothetical protein n=1 Tax=Streptomyces sp. NPDC000594 TaxID=3154261 RepID=UPI0033271511
MRSRQYDFSFRYRAGRIRTWGIALLAVAALLWTWCAVLLLTPYEVDEEPFDRYPVQCESRLWGEPDENESPRRAAACLTERDWPEALALLALSVPVSTAGVALFVSGGLSRRMSAHAEAMRELDRVADEQKA